MIDATSQPATKPAHNRLFYPIASLFLLVVMFLGFRFFTCTCKRFPVGR